MAERIKITDQFGESLAVLLAQKIEEIYSDFQSDKFIDAVKIGVENLSYTQRIIFIAEQLFQFLPQPYENGINILTSILGEENPNEEGMFTEYWWIMPIGKYVELFGIDHLAISLKAIEEITKRNTGEYAIRPFIRRYPSESLDQMRTWANSDNFHLRRLASEGLRPKLPWSTKLDVFHDDPKRVFEILETLKEDDRMFVKKSVANHLTDWLKVHYDTTKELLLEWQKSSNKNTQWIIKTATRKIKI